MSGVVGSCGSTSCGCCEVVANLHDTCRHYEKRLQQQQKLLDKFVAMAKDAKILANGDLL